MKFSDRTKDIFRGGALILVTNLILQRDWETTLLSALFLVLGGFILPPLVTFMSDEKRDNYYK